MTNEELAKLKPCEARKLIRDGKLLRGTSGISLGYAQANLVILPKKDADDFLLFTQRNSKACPVLEVSDPGSRTLSYLGKDIDLANDFGMFCVYKNGELTEECESIEKYWRDDLVAFLIGCSYSFESDLLEVGIRMKHIELGKVVSVYKTNIECQPAGKFKGNMVVSMRPIKYNKVVDAVKITAEMPRVHGAPIHIGYPELIGIDDLNKVSYGEAIEIEKDEIPVFWPCGVTPQNVVMNSKPEFCITHKAGYMLITDIKNAELKL